MLKLAILAVLASLATSTSIETHLRATSQAISDEHQSGSFENDFIDDNFSDELPNSGSFEFGLRGDSSSHEDFSDESSRENVITLRNLEQFPREDFDSREDSDEIFLPRSNIAFSSSSLEDDSDEIFLPLVRTAVAPRVAPRPVYGAPRPTGYGYRASQCNPETKYSVVTHQIFVPTVKRITATQYLPKTVYSSIVQTKYYGPSEIEVVTITKIDDPDVVTKTKVVEKQVYVPKTKYATATKYITATQLKSVYLTSVSMYYNTVTDTVYRTRTQYQTQVRTHTVPEYHTITQPHYRTQTQRVSVYKTVTVTGTLYKTHQNYNTVHVTHTVSRLHTTTQHKTHKESVLVYRTLVETETRQSYFTEQVPVYKTMYQTKYKHITSLITKEKPVYRTVVSKLIQQKLITITAKNTNCYHHDPW